jgi:hypothetical protein
LSIQTVSCDERSPASSADVLAVSSLPRLHAATIAYIAGRVTLHDAASFAFEELHDTIPRAGRLLFD